MLVEVVKPFRYGKQREKHTVGEMLEIPDAHARVLMAIGRVRLPGLASVADMPEAPLTDRAYDLPSLDELPKPKRKYKRRDMRAE